MFRLFRLIHAVAVGLVFTLVIVTTQLASAQVGFPPVTHTVTSVYYYSDFSGGGTFIPSPEGWRQAIFGLSNMSDSNQELRLDYYNSLGLYLEPQGEFTIPASRMISWMPVGSDYLLVGVLGDQIPRRPRLNDPKRNGSLGISYDSLDAHVVGAQVNALYSGALFAQALPLDDGNLPDTQGEQVLVIPYILDSAGTNVGFPSALGTVGLVYLQNMTGTEIFGEVSYWTPEGTEITPEENEFSIDPNVGFRYRPAIADEDLQHGGLEWPTTGYMMPDMDGGEVMGSVVIRYTGAHGDLLSYVSMSDIFHSANSYSVPLTGEGVSELSVPYFEDNAPANAAWPPATGTTTLLCVHNAGSESATLTLRYTQLTGEDATPVIDQIVIAPHVTLIWRPRAQDSASGKGRESISGRNVPDMTGGEAEGSLVIASNGGALTGSVLVADAQSSYSYAMAPGMGQGHLAASYFIDTAPASGSAGNPASGFQTTLRLRNFASAPVSIKLSYSGFETEDRTPAYVYFTLGADETLSWRPAVSDAAYEGPGNVVPDMTADEFSIGGAQIFASAPTIAGIAEMRAPNGDRSVYRLSASAEYSQPADSDLDGIPDYIEGDGNPDGDAFVNLWDYDSDGDGIEDAIEGVSDFDGDGMGNSTDSDSDNDGALDGTEGAGDTDGDGIPDFLDLDSDDDGYPDAVEHAAGSSLVSGASTPVLTEVWVDTEWSTAAPAYLRKAGTRANPLDAIETAFDWIQSGGTIGFVGETPDAREIMLESGRLDTPLRLTSDGTIRLTVPAAKSISDVISVEAFIRAFFAGVEQ